MPDTSLWRQWCRPSEGLTRPHDRRSWCTERPASPRSWWPAVRAGGRDEAASVPAEQLATGVAVGAVRRVRGAGQDVIAETYVRPTRPQSIPPVRRGRPGARTLTKPARSDLRGAGRDLVGPALRAGRLDAGDLVDALVRQRPGDARENGCVGPDEAAGRDDPVGRTRVHRHARCDGRRWRIRLLVAVGHDEVRARSGGGDSERTRRRIDDGLGHDRRGRARHLQVGCRRSGIADARRRRRKCRRVVGTCRLGAVAVDPAGRRSRRESGRAASGQGRERGLVVHPRRVGARRLVVVGRPGRGARGARRHRSHARERAGGRLRARGDHGAGGAGSARRAGTATSEIVSGAQVVLR